MARMWRAPTIELTRTILSHSLGAEPLVDLSIKCAGWVAADVSRR